MPTPHGFCTLHRIAYLRSLDATCPQCTMAHIGGAAQLDYEPVQAVAVTTSGGPMDPASGQRLDAITLQPVK